MEVNSNRASKPWTGQAYISQAAVCTLCATIVTLVQLLSRTPLRLTAGSNTNLLALPHPPTPEKEIRTFCR